MIAAPAMAERRTAAKVPTLLVIFKAETAALVVVAGAEAPLVAELGEVLVAGVLEAARVVPNPVLNVEGVIIGAEVVTEAGLDAEEEPDTEEALVFEVVLLALVTDVTLVAPLGPIAKSPEVAKTLLMFPGSTACRV